MQKALGISDTVLRDAPQSLLATRMRTDDMLRIADRLDRVGYYALEVWGGATFDACMRFLNEDPWERLRVLRQAMPHTPLMMLQALPRRRRRAVYRAGQAQWHRHLSHLRRPQ